MGEQTRQQVSVKTAYNLMGALFFSCLRIEFGKGGNAMFGPHDLFRHLVTMCTDRSCAEGAYQDSRDDPEHLHLPSGRWLLNRIKSVRYDWMLKRCDLAFMRLVRRMRSQGMLRGAVDVAIDFHNIGRYDKHPDMKFMRKSKYKNGTCNFNVFATVHCVVDGSRLCLGAILATRADFKVEMVSKLLDKCEENRVRINMLTLDREFYTREIMSLLNRREIQFLMPAVKKAIGEFKAGERKAVSRHTITSSDRISAEFTLIIRKAKDATDAAKVATGEGNKEDEPVYHVFATNVPEDAIRDDPDGFVELYRKRWGIEIAYRCYEKARPRTTSRNESVRILLMFFPFLLYNAWILAGHFIEESGLDPRGRKRMTLSRFKKLLVRLSTGSALKEHPPKRHPPDAG